VQKVNQKRLPMKVAEKRRCRIIEGLKLHIAAWLGLVCDTLADDNSFLKREKSIQYNCINRTYIIHRYLAFKKDTEIHL
jgi:hypothetical protein